MKKINLLVLALGLFKEPRGKWTSMNPPMDAPDFIINLTIMYRLTLGLKL